MTKPKKKNLTPEEAAKLALQKYERIKLTTGVALKHLQAVRVIIDDAGRHSKIDFCMSCWFRKDAQFKINCACALSHIVLSKRYLRLRFSHNNVVYTAKNGGHFEGPEAGAKALCITNKESAWLFLRDSYNDYFDNPITAQDVVNRIDKLIARYMKKRIENEGMAVL